MKNILVYILLLSVFIFSGCSYKIDTADINRDIVPSGNNHAKLFLESKTYYTYDMQKAKITGYFFKNKNGYLTMSNFVEYIPYDLDDQLYSPFSNVTWTLNRLTNNKAKTIEEALKQEVLKNNSTLLFKSKREFIIGNKFANSLLSAIREYNEKLERQDNDRSKIVIPK